MYLSEELQSFLIEQYWLNYRLSTGNRQERLAAKELTFWAGQEVRSAAVEAREGVMDLLIALAEYVADDDRALSYLGAGEIEDLLSHHANEFIDQIDTAARRFTSFRMALRAAWFDSFLPSEQALRLRSFGPTY